MTVVEQTAAEQGAGVMTTMSSVFTLHDELLALNERTLQLSPAQLSSARFAGPAEDPTPENMAPFGLAVFTAAAEFAVTNRVPLILDY
jgi:hypothetical protein